MEMNARSDPISPAQEGWAWGFHPHTRLCPPQHPALFYDDIIMREDLTLTTPVPHMKVPTPPLAPDPPAPPTMSFCYTQTQLPLPHTPQHLPPRSPCPNRRTPTASSATCTKTLGIPPAQNLLSHTGSLHIFPHPAPSCHPRGSLQLPTHTQHHPKWSLQLPHTPSTTLRALYSSTHTQHHPRVSTAPPTPPPLSEKPPHGSRSPTSRLHTGSHTGSPTARSAHSPVRQKGPHTSPPPPR